MIACPIARVSGRGGGDGGVRGGIKILGAGEGVVWKGRGVLGAVEGRLSGARGFGEVLVKVNGLAESLAARANEDALCVCECLRIADGALMRLVEVTRDALGVEEIAVNWTWDLVWWRWFDSHRVLEVIPARRGGNW